MEKMESFFYHGGLSTVHGFWLIGDKWWLWSYGSQGWIYCKFFFFNTAKTDLKLVTRKRKLFLKKTKGIDKLDTYLTISVSYIVKSGISPTDKSKRRTPSTVLTFTFSLSNNLNQTILNLRVSLNLCSNEISLQLLLNIIWNQHMDS